MKKQKIQKSVRKPVILITGGGRFLGATLARSLSTEGYNLVLLDNLSIGSYQNIKDITRLKNVAFINCDINQGIPQSIKSVNYIFHLAGTKVNFSGVPETSLHELLANSVGTETLLELATLSSARLLYTSNILLYATALDKLHMEFDQQSRNTHSHLEAKRFGEALVTQYSLENNLDTRIVRLPQVYGPGMNLQSDKPLGSLVKQAASGENLVSGNDELEKHYYLFIDDAIEGLKKAMFTKDVKGLTIPLIPDSPITTTQIIKELDNLTTYNLNVVQEDFSEIKTTPTNITDMENLAMLDWRGTTTLSSGLKKTINKLNVFAPSDETPKIERGKKKELQKKSVSPKVFLSRRPKKKATKPVLEKKDKLGKKRKRPGRKTAAFTLGLLIIAYLSVFPAITTLIHLGQGVSGLKKAENNLTAFQFVEAKESSFQAENHFTQALADLKKLQPISKALGQNKRATTVKHSLTAGVFISRSLQSVSGGVGQITSTLIESAPSLITGGSTPVENLTQQDIQKALTELTNAHRTILLAEAELKEINATQYPTYVREEFIDVEENIQKVKKDVEIAEQILKVMPQLVGINSPQKYLVLFQNSNEIRPTGGFIGSFAEILVADGFIKDIRIDDVYNPDGTLVNKDIKIEPPAPIKTILGQEYWSLRDANWDVSFPEASKDLYRFYTLGSGTPVDGILAIDLQFMESLLKVTGPITMSTYSEEISQNNLFEKAELHSEGAFLEGANYKKTFLSTLGQLLIEKVLRLEQDKYPELAGQMLAALNEKHLLINSKNPTLQAVLKDQDWDGSVTKTSGDYLYVVDANLGANKANYYVSRAVNYNVQGQDRQGTLTSTLALTYIHTGTTDTWPGGTYRNYLRVLTPLGSRLIKATRSLSDSDEPGKEITNSIQVGEESGKTVFATLLELEHSKSVSLTLKYQLPTNLSIKPDVNTYSLAIQKQPGAKNDPLTFSFNVPFGREIVNLPDGFNTSGDLVRYTDTLTKDEEFLIKLK